MPKQRIECVHCGDLIVEVDLDFYDPDTLYEVCKGCKFKGKEEKKVAKD